MQWAYIPWYNFLKTHGIQAIGTNFSDYAPPYLYLLWLATFTSNYLPSIVAIKLIPIIADVINAIFVYRIVRLKYPTGPKPLLASALFWVLPTVMMNSSLWGQTDALYTLFLLVCLYYLLTDKPLSGVVAFRSSHYNQGTGDFYCAFACSIVFQETHCMAIFSCGAANLYRA